MKWPFQFSAAPPCGFNGSESQPTEGSNRLNEIPPCPCQNRTPVLMGAVGRTRVSMWTAFHDPPSAQPSSALLVTDPVSPMTSGRCKLCTLLTYALNVPSHSALVHP